MQDMIDHHAMAVKMAELCVQKAVHAELRAMCEDIIAGQTQEMQQMQMKLQQWYGVSHDPEMTPGEMNMMERHSMMSGAEFEIMFMEMMMRHHWRAIVQAAGCLDRAYHPELKAMCENIIVTQSAEISQLREWLCQWYGKCDYGPKGNGPTAH